MKREIRFRGRRLDNQEWVYGFYGVTGQGTDIEKHWIMQTTLDNNGSIPRFYFFDIEVDFETVGQFTGLLDKNGREIYDGDLDKSGLIIKWNQLHCCFGLFTESGYLCELYADCCDNKGKAPKQWMTSQIEIIGNIYENPELLQP